MLDNYSSIQLQVLKEFKKTNNFYMAANNVCSKYNISIFLSENNISVYYKQNKVEQKKTPTIWTSYSIGLDIIWSTVLLYKDLLNEGLIFDFNTRLQYASHDVGDIYTCNSSIELEEEHIPDQVRKEFEEIIYKMVYPTQELYYFFKHNFTTRSTVRHKQTISIAWIGIGVSMLTSVFGIILL